MKKIQSIQELNEIVTAFQKQHKKVSTNCYLMRDELTRLIAQGRLHLLQAPGLLIILCGRPDYENLYYHAAEGASLPDLSSLAAGAGKKGDERKILLDVISSRNRPAKADPFISSMLSDDRIARFKRYQRMAFDLAGEVPLELSHGFPEGYRLMTGSIPYAEVISLWKTALDEKSTPLPDAVQLERSQAEGTLSCVEDIRDGRLCAVITLDIQGNAGLLQHLAVLPQYRRQGLASALFKRGVSQALEAGLKTLRLWVDVENTNAITLYRREGFSPDGILCDQYYLK